MVLLLLSIMASTFLELAYTKCHFTKILEAALLAIEVVQSFGYTKCQLIITLSAAALDRCCGPGCEAFFLDFFLNKFLP